MRLKFSFIWTVLMTTTARCTDSVTTCFTKPSPDREEVVLVCRFPEPVTQIRKDISVQRNEFNNASASAPSVLECPLSRRQDPGGCVAGAGYIFKGFSFNSNEVEIYIHNVSKEHEGSYTCQLVGHSSIIIPCNFTLSLIPPGDRRNDVETSQSSVSSTSTTNGTEGEKQVQTADLNIAAIVVSVVIGAVVVVAIVIVVYVFTRRNRQKINRAASPIDDSCAHNRERQPLTGDPCDPESTTWDVNEEEAADKDRANGDDATEENGDENGSEHRDDDGDKRNNDGNEYSKPGMSRDYKEMEDVEGAGATQNGPKKGLGAMENSLKNKPVVKQLKQNNEKGVDNLRKVPDKRKSARKEKEIHTTQETYNESEYRDDDGDERNTEENEHSRSGTSRNDKGKEVEEGPGASKNALMVTYDPVVKELKQNNEKGEDNLRKIPNKRKSACREPKENVNTFNLQEPEKTLTVIHEET